MVDVIALKLCFHNGKRYRVGDAFTFTGAKKDLPKYLQEIKQDKK